MKKSNDSVLLDRLDKIKAMCEKTINHVDIVSDELGFRSDETKRLKSRIKDLEMAIKVALNSVDRVPGNMQWVYVEHGPIENLTKVLNNKEAL